MTTTHRHALLAHTDNGRPPKPPRKSVILWRSALKGFRPASLLLPVPPPPPESDDTKLVDFSGGDCNIWRGNWIRNPVGPAYTNTTCQFIQENQDCMKLGRPDLGFLYWRWKPHDCELPLFDARAFLRIVAGKMWAFIGDSIARNNYQSVLCHLAQIENPECDEWKSYCYFRSYNFTILIAWAPFLVKGFERAEGFTQYIAKLHLDEPDERWASTLHKYDYIVLSAGRWFMRDSLYFVQNELMGCHNCPMLNATNVGWPYAYRVALRASFDFLIAAKYKGVVFFRTISPDHWQNGAWDQGGECPQTAPFKSKSYTVDGLSRFMYNMQLEEFNKTVQRSSEYSFKLKIVDTLFSALLRPDAHPGPYGHFHSNVKNDCLHWCLPGAVDTWSAMLLHVLKHL
ncbi:hypothetical protein GOP47_0028141 [Adiantum capillus-veneris]|nr:hypothetical protein GOP47_0028140 [Adiantum capillus-veneris]KAI5056323.1 hypothetical protein GOP47_0028141 [Adiantum capillus-veneris]